MLLVHYRLNPDVRLYKKNHGYHLYKKDDFYKIDSQTGDFLVEKYKTSFDKESYIKKFKVYKESNGVLNFMLAESILRKFHAKRLKINLTDHQLMRNEGYQIIRNIAVSKNGRVYLVGKKNKKYIFKFQITQNPLIFWFGINLPFVPKLHAYSLKHRWYVQDYISGQSLVGMSDKIINVTVKKKIKSQIQKIQKALQRVGVVHGDIHPGNFILDSKMGLHLIDIDNSYHINFIDKIKFLIRPTGAQGFAHPDIKSLKRIPDYKTEAYSFKKVIEYLQI
jgi:serine/threonine protein kinase